MRATAGMLRARLATGNAAIPVQQALNALLAHLPEQVAELRPELLRSIARPNEICVPERFRWALTDSKL